MRSSKSRSHQADSQFARVRLLQADSAMSVLGLITTNTSSGLAYTPYGYLAASIAGAWVGFTGHYRDLALNGYLLGNGTRLYSPSLMRFDSADKLSPFGKGGGHGYSYCQGDPINRDDPSGGVSRLWQKARAVKTQIKVVKAFNSRTQLADLPDEMINEIAGYLPRADAINFSLSSKRNYAVLTSGFEAMNQLLASEPAGLDRAVKLLIEMKKPRGPWRVPSIGAGLSPEELSSTIRNRGREHYLPHIQRVELDRERIRREQLAEEILQQNLAANGHWF